MGIHDVLENDWKFMAKLTAKVIVFTVVQMISENIFGRTSSVWETRCSVAVLSTTRTNGKL